MQNDLLLRFYHELRTELFHTELLLQQTPTSDAKAWTAAITQVQQVLQRCAANTAQTEAHLYPLVEEYEPSVVDSLRQQQRIINAQQFAVAVVALPFTTISGDQEKARHDMIAAFDAVVLGQMQYLLKLQNCLLPVLKRYYSSELLSEIGSLIIKKASAQPAGSGQTQERRAAELAFRRSIHQSEVSLHGAQSLGNIVSGWPALVTHY